MNSMDKIRAERSTIINDLKTIDRMSKTMTPDERVKAKWYKAKLRLRLNSLTEQLGR